MRSDRYVKIVRVARLLDPLQLSGVPGKGYWPVFAGK